MTQIHETVRIIDGKRCLCVDVGCDDFDRAAFNRYIIKNKLFTTAYILVENAIAHTPLKQPLASWIPRGALPQVGKKDWQQAGGEEGRFYELGNASVVELDSR